MNKKTGSLLVLLSGLFYSCAFITIDYTWWAILIFPLPLFIAAQQTNINFLFSLLWGISCTGAHISGLSYALFNLSQGPTLHRLLIPLLISFYLWSLITVWFWATKKIASRISPHITWILSLTCLFIFLSDYALIICGQEGGFFFIHPLIPLCRTTILPKLITLLSDRCVILAIITINYGIGWLYVRNKTYSICSCIVWISIWMAPLGEQTSTSPIWKKEMQTISAVYSKQCDERFMIHSISEQAVDILQRYPQTKVIALTESSFYGDLSSQSFLSCLLESTFPSKLNLFIGAFRNHENDHFNTLYWFKNKQLKGIFDKRKLLPFVEKVPNLCNTSTFSDLFFSSTKQLSPSITSRPLFEVTTDISFVPYLCWELFGSRSPDDAYPQYTAIAFCNDRHFPIWMAHLMRVATQLKGYIWNRSIIYIGNSQTNSPA